MRRTAVKRTERTASMRIQTILQSYTRRRRMEKDLQFLTQSKLCLEKNKRHQALVKASSVSLSPPPRPFIYHYSSTIPIFESLLVVVQMILWVMSCPLIPLWNFSSREKSRNKVCCSEQGGAGVDICIYNSWINEYFRGVLQRERTSCSGKRGGRFGYDSVCTLQSTSRHVTYYLHNCVFLLVENKTKMFIPFLF